MDNIDVEVMRTAIAWMGSGQRVTLCTVVRTWGSAPRPPGSWMVIREDGQVTGSVSGGCIEDDLVYRVTSGELRLERPLVITYGEGADESRRFGLPCGGTVELVLEPLSVRSCLPELLSAIEGSRRMLRRIEIANGHVELFPFSSPVSDVSLQDGFLTTVHGPSWRLLVIGGGHLTRYLAVMARMLNFNVIVCEPREEYLEGWEAIDGVKVVSVMPDDLVISLQLDPHSAVVATTHDPKLDDLALMEALRTQAFYVGVIGSLHNNTARRKRLLEFDVTHEQVSRLKGPVGLNLGGLTPPEIALSILAEITAIRHGVPLDGSLVSWTSTKTLCRTSD